MRKYANYLSSLLVFLSVFSFSQAFAGSGAKVKKARHNDIAKEYILHSNGDFFRTIKADSRGESGLKCQITNKVKDFKISQHPNDEALVYFVRQDKYNELDLYVLNNTGETHHDGCPRAKKTMILRQVQEYSVVPSTHTTIVNLALSKDHFFAAWDNSHALVRTYGVVDYTMNQCFGVKGKSFNSYVAFAIDRDGYVFKVKGQDPENSKWDQGHQYRDLREFKEKNNVCR